MHYYQHHIGDFLRDAGSLPNEALGAYMRLLWRYYADESPIQGEPEDIAFDLSTSPETVRQLLRRYFCQTAEGWRHSRCDREIEQYRRKADKASASAKARWANANAMRTHSERNANETVSDANQEPITNNQERAKDIDSSTEESSPAEAGPSRVIAEAYHAIMCPTRESGCERVRAWTPKRLAKLRAADKLAASLCRAQGWDYGGRKAEFWSAYFEQCRKDPWLRGDVANPKNAGWKQNIWVLVDEKRFGQIMDQALAAMEDGE
jgi:uncharacterized protein YdaU (DUF1376 family)